jgi:hypothetical protein
LDQLMREWMRETTEIGGRNLVWASILALFTSFFLSMALAFVYRLTHRGLSYSVSFVHTIIVMGVTVSVIMVLIGSNLARAFALVGALSIIRFRTAIKDPRDVAFIFMAMAAGMACGVGYYVIGLVFTLFVCPMTWFLYRFEIGSMPSSEVLLKVDRPSSVDYHHAFDEVFYRYLRDHSLLSVETIRGGELLELVYSVHFKRGADEGAFVDALRAVNMNHRVVLLTGAQNVAA